MKLNLTISTGAKITVARIIRMGTKVINQVSLVCTTIHNIISKINMIIIRSRWWGNSIIRIINSTSCTNTTNSWNTNIKAIKIIWCRSERVLFMEKVHNIKILFKWCKLRPMRMLLVVSYIFSRWPKFKKIRTTEHITCSNKLLLGAWYMVLMECHLCLFSALLWMAPHLLIMGFPAKKCHIMCLYLHSLLSINFKISHTANKTWENFKRRKTHFYLIKVRIKLPHSIKIPSVVNSRLRKQQSCIKQTQSKLINLKINLFTTIQSKAICWKMWIKIARCSFTQMPITLQAVKIFKLYSSIIQKLLKKVTPRIEKRMNFFSKIMMRMILIIILQGIKIGNIGKPWWTPWY